MAVTDTAVAADLAPAGLQFLERLSEQVKLPLPPPPPYLSPASCRSEHGRFDSRPEEVVDVEDPEMPAKVNAGWWRMATEYGLFDHRREFLLGVDDSDSDRTWLKIANIDRVQFTDLLFRC